MVRKVIRVFTAGLLTNTDKQEGYKDPILQLFTHQVFQSKIVSLRISPSRYNQFSLKLPKNLEYFLADYRGGVEALPSLPPSQELGRHVPFILRKKNN